MVTCTPEPVSTDHAPPPRLYFEPLTFEDVMSVIDREQPEGVILTLGGQTPLKLAVALERAGVPVLGTAPDAIDRAEDRGRFTELLSELGIAQAPGGVAWSRQTIVDATERLALALGVRGLINAQYAVKDGGVYCLEVNPRASRTAPFVGKATGVPLAKVAVRVMLGEALASIGRLPRRSASGPWWGHDLMSHVAVKEAVLPFGRFPGVDTILGPEMRSTG